jgi:hypothetical protein
MGHCPSWTAGAPGHCAYAAPATTHIIAVPFQARVAEYHSSDWPIGTGTIEDIDYICRSSGGVWVP